MSKKSTAIDNLKIYFFAMLVKNIFKDYIEDWKLIHIENYLDKNYGVIEWKNNNFYWKGVFRNDQPFFNKFLQWLYINITLVFVSFMVIMFIRIFYVYFKLNSKKVKID
jgi:hypothetical protein